LIIFSLFYTTNYLGRFNFWPLAPLIREDLHLTNVQIGLINAALLWGFCLGDVIHGSMSERYGFKLWILCGAILTTVCNIIVSFSDSFLFFLIPWFLCGFCNAACWAPGIGMVSQWWNKSERGFALGVVSGASGGAMLLMWSVTGLIGTSFDWRMSFRYPPIIIAVAAIIVFVMCKDFPSSAGFSNRTRKNQNLLTWAKYKLILKNPKFHLIGHIKGLENVVRYGLMTWIPLYYYDKGGFDIRTTILITILLPIGYMIAPPIAGILSDKMLHSDRKPLTLASCVLSSGVLFCMCFVDPNDVFIGCVLMIIGGLSLGMSQLPVMAVDFFGKDLAATTSSLVDAHGYFYAGVQAVIISLIVGVMGNWAIVFLLMGSVRLLSAGVLLVARLR
jgi:OPA family glycerol-3-phosphate transporter-like MFS transporter